MVNALIRGEQAAARAAAPDERTRERVLRAISRNGPVTTAAVADLLLLSDTAIRRHVDNLLDAGLIEAHDPAPARRGRGRPARSFVVSEQGHRALASDYDDLAGDAVRFLADAAGPEAVAAFARMRVARWEARYAAELGSRHTVSERVEGLVEALTRDGFDASARPIGDPARPTPSTGIQLCQGHCPVHDVAAQFPQFCDAETEAFSRLLGVHVQRLATLARGEHVCTTYIPHHLQPPPTGSGSADSPNEGITP